MRSFVSIVLILVAVIGHIRAVSYEVIVSMDDNTVRELQKQGYSLYIFKGVQASTRALSTVWVKQNIDSDYLKFSWEDKYHGYITPLAINPDVVIDEFTNLPLEGGQIAEVSSNSYSALTLDESNVGEEHAYYLRNKSKEPITGGLLQAHGPFESPFCVMSLPVGEEENNLLEIVPLQRVYLTFSTANYAVGTVVTNTSSAGLLLDMAAYSNIAVSYDISEGWNDVHSAYAMKVPSKQPFQSFLNVLSH